MPWFDSIRDATGHNFVRRLDVDTAMQCSVKGTAQRITTMHFRHDVPNVVWSRDAVMDEDAPNHQNSLFSLHLAADVAAKRPTACFDVARCQGARSVELRAGELAIVLDGIDLSKLKRVPRYTRISNENQKAILL